MSSNRWEGIERPYDWRDVISLRGSLTIKHTLAENGAKKFWNHLQKKNPLLLWGQ